MKMRGDPRKGERERGERAGSKRGHWKAETKGESTGSR